MYKADKIKYYYFLIKYKILFYIWCKLESFTKHLEWQILEPMYKNKYLQDKFNKDYEDWNGN